MENEENYETEKPKNNLPKVMIMIGLLLITFGIMYPSIMEMMGGGSSNTVDQSTSAKAKEDTTTNDEPDSTSTAASTPATAATAGTVCTYLQQYDTNTSMTTTVTINGENDLATSVVQSTKYDFTATGTDIYTAEKTKCEGSAILNGQPGLLATCSATDLSIETTYTFDLTQFQPINNTATGVQLASPVEANSSIEAAKTNFITQGYTCQ